MEDSTKYRVDPAQLGEWLRVISVTEDDEIDCDALAEVVEDVVEAAIAGVDVRELFPHIALHLDHCPDCRDWYETLVALSKESE